MQVSARGAVTLDLLTVFRREASTMTLDEAWAAAKAVVPGARLTVFERETTVEAYAKDGINALGYGYGKTPVEALQSLTAHLTKEATDGRHEGSGTVDPAPSGGSEAPTGG